MFLTTWLGKAFVTLTKGTEGQTGFGQRGLVTYAKIPCEGQPSLVALEVRFEPAPKANHLFLVRDGCVQELAFGQTSSIAVPVRWRNGVPQTRFKEQQTDNLDLVAVKSDGSFVDVECGIVTRAGKFFMTAQRIYEGCAVRTRNPENRSRVVWDTVPTKAVHAYPGCTFKGIWDSVAEKLMEKVHDFGASTQRSRVKIATWNPPPLPVPPDGWRAGVVDYFNLISGTGQIADSDGVKHFVHFKDIRNAGMLPMLTPMHAVLFQPGPDEGYSRQGTRKVSAVKTLTEGEPL